MNITKLKQAEADFLTRYPGGFADPGMAHIKKKHNVDKLSEFAQANLTRAHFNRPEHIADTLVRIISRSSMVSMFEKPRFRDFIRALNSHEKEHLALAFEKRLPETAGTGEERDPPLALSQLRSGIGLPYEHHVVEKPSATALE